MLVKYVLLIHTQCYFDFGMYSKEIIDIIYSMTTKNYYYL